MNNTANRLTQPSHRSQLKLLSFCLCCCFVLIAQAATLLAQDQFTAASHNDHIWFAQQIDQDKVDVLHKYDKTEEGVINRIKDLEFTPLFSASDGTNFYLMNESGKIAQVGLRTPTASQPGVGYIYNETYAQLPSDVKPISMRYQNNQLWVLARFISENENVIGQYQLLKFNASDWTRIELPRFLVHSQTLSFAVNGSSEIAMLAHGDNLPPVLYLKKDTAGWEQVITAPFTFKHPQIHWIDNQRIITDWHQDKLHLYNLQDKAINTIRSIDMPLMIKRSLRIMSNDKKITVAFSGGGAREQFELTSIFPFQEGQDKQTLKAVQFTSNANNDPTMYAMILVFLIVTISMLSNWRKPPNRTEVVLPENTMIAGVFKRASACIVDIVGPVLITMAIFGNYEMNSIFFFNWPAVRGIGLTEMLSGVVCLALLLIYGTISEAIFGQTLGKRLLGCRVCNQKGEKPAIWQIFLRNLMKVLEIVSPPLLLMPLISHLKQRLGDIAAKTIVVMDIPKFRQDQQQNQQKPPQDPDQ